MIKNLANRLGLSDMHMYIYAFVLVALIFNIFTNNTYADNETSDTTTIAIRTSCSITATITSEHSATMVNGTYSGTNYPNGIGSTTMQTFCNDRNGYAIYAVGYTNNEEGNTVLKGNAGLDPSNDIVTGIATSGTSGNDVSNWAMKVSAVSGTYAPTITNGFNDFSSVPSTYTEVAQYNHPTDSASGTNIGSTITTTYAAYISNTQPAGTYVGQVKYVLVHPDYNVSSARVMQNIAEWEDELLPGVQATAVDNRDGTEYTVAKLKDGNIWMLDNLALGSDTAMTLTNADTNMSAASWILPASTTTGFTNDNTGYTTKAINADSKTTTQPLAMEQSGTGKVGVYYNYCAASAGTYCMESGSGSGNATSDICPKGWRLPTGGPSGEFQALWNQYSSSGEFALALRTPLSGWFYDGLAEYQGSWGNFWSSTRNNGYRMYYLYVDLVDVYPQLTDDRPVGFSVRCVRETLPTMQSVTTSELDGLMPNAGDTTILRDSRDDTEYTIGKLADGNYWMLDNLALDPATLKSGVTLDSSNTNLSAGKTFTLPDSTTTGFTLDDTSFQNPAVNTASKNTSQSLAVGQSGTGKIGVYYNYCAASAGTYCESTSQTGTSNATNDICPKGWRLPTGGESGEFQALRNQYASAGEYALALRTPLSGDFYDGSEHNQGGVGSFWSSTFGTATNMYYLSVVTRGVYPQLTFSRHYGFSVRCVKQ